MMYVEILEKGESMRWIYYIGLMSICALSLEARSLIFASLPYKNNAGIVEDFAPMLRYLESDLNRSIEFRFEPSYQKLIADFIDNKIDMAYMGPLPTLALMKQDASALPVVTFNDAKGKNGYRCVLVKFMPDMLMLEQPQTLKVALTEPLSTCGYFSTAPLVQTYAKAPLSTMHYRYVHKHDEVALSVLRGEFHLGGMKESIAESYRSLGLEIIAYSPIVPSFALVLNTKTLSSEQIEAIRTRLLNAPAKEYASWGKEISWGVQAVQTDTYRHMQFFSDIESIPQEGNLR